MKSQNSAAIKTMRRELARVQRAQNECVTEHGVVRRECRYKYQMLTRQAAELRGSIEWMSKLYEEVGA